jgi:hypothetical protein
MKVLTEENHRGSMSRQKLEDKDLDIALGAGV